MHSFSLSLVILMEGLLFLAPKMSHKQKDLYDSRRLSLVPRVLWNAN